MFLVAEISIVSILVPFAIFICVGAFAWALLGRGGSEEQHRAEARLEEMRKPHKRSDLLDEDDRENKKSQALAAVLEKATSPFGNAVQMKDQKALGKLRERLLHAGIRIEAAPGIFKGCQLILAGVGLLIGGAIGALVSGINGAMVAQLALGGGLGYFLPEIILSVLCSRRKMAIFLGLPDALDLLVVCVEAGLGLDQAMRKVSEEMKKSYPQVADEFAVANTQLQFGRPRTEVLQALGYRSGVEDLKSLSSILIQADKFGSSIAQALRVQSDAMRVKRRQLAEEKAAKSAVKLIFPLVLFIFPGIFVVLIGPAALTMYDKLLSQ